MAQRSWMMRSCMVGLLAGLGLGAGLGAMPKAAQAADDGGTLTISDAQFLWTCGFSPFNPNSNFLSVGPVYETLMFVDTLQNAKTTPWLATSYAWSNDNKVITFTLRHGVKWTDGTPFTAADVAFTFNMLKKYPALDLNSVWSVLSSVTQSGDTVIFDFKSASVPYFYYIADQVAIVPEHIWSKLSNPATYADANPVGTGAYVVNPCSPQNITYTPNKYYWQPGEPKIAKVLYPAFTSNNTANTYLTTGQAQWGSQFMPNISTLYSNKSPDNHYWFPPISNVSLIPNLTVPGLDDVAVRQAMAYAINRPQVANIGEYGEEDGANQTGIVTPTFSAWKDTAQAASYGNDYAYDPAKAKQVLQADGYKLGSNGIFAKNGKQLSFTVINIGGYSDWVASMSVIQSELKAVGISITPENLAQNTDVSDLLTGDFQLAYYDATGGPSPEYELRQWLFSGNTAPIGKDATTNYERYSNPATDKLFAEYGQTTSTATQHQIVDQLQQVMLSQVPIIPVTEEADWFQYNTSGFTGWPTQSDPYALPAIYQYPDMGQVLLHLVPKS
jgi:peptide/nickel transport system substrate-binding protein